MGCTTCPSLWFQEDFLGEVALRWRHQEGWALGKLAGRLGKGWVFGQRATWHLPRLGVCIFQKVSWGEWRGCGKELRAEPRHAGLGGCLEDHQHLPSWTRNISGFHSRKKEDRTCFPKSSRGKHRCWKSGYQALSINQAKITDVCLDKDGVGGPRGSRSSESHIPGRINRRLWQLGVGAWVER